MQRLKPVGLALLAVLAVTVVAASAAQAALPEFVVGGFPKKFTAAAGAGKLETVGKREVNCTSGAGEGEITAEKETKKTVVKFKGCTATGAFGIKVKCKSAGAAVEEIVTNALVGKLRDLSIAKTEDGIVLEPEVAGGLFAKFECGGIQELKVRGASIGQVTTLNKLQATQKLKFEQAGGKQKWVEYEEPNGTKVKPAKNETEGVKLGFGGENFAFEESAVEGEPTQELTTKANWEIKG